PGTPPAMNVLRAVRFLPLALLPFAVAALVLAPGVAIPPTAAAQEGVSEEFVAKIREALPEKAPAETQRPRKLLVFSKTNGFRHSSIPVGARAITMLGEQTGAF